MAEVKRWSVTYTKHVKQKPKVYQDGFLELHTSSNKMLLFDEREKLLECRMLKREEAVSSGETLTFNAFLVDVNDAEGDQKPKAAAGMNFSEKRAKSWNKPKPFQTPVQNMTGGKKPLQNLSPSKNIIREFKKRELHKYNTATTSISSPETVKTSTTEWQALYTTQLTQKAKKYHDGFLQLAITGSYGKQIILLDSSRSQLTSRFLKKDEVITSGGSITFDGHLVDIGDKEGDHKTEENLHPKEDKRNIVVKTRIKQEESNGVVTSKDDGKEWKVLFTAQVNQKAKKYHDGVLKIALKGSFGRQAMLYDASRKLLETRFLKTEEVIRSGESFAFGAHLVDIGEPEENEADNDLKLGAKEFHVQKSRKLQGNDDPIIIDDVEVKEWKVLCTTQVAQKAKKYHDGFLKIASKGSFGRQAMLYDASRKLLETRFLKTDEVIRSGESFTFSAHLVDIVEPEGNEAGLDLKFGAKEFHVQNSRKLHREDDPITIDDVEVKEWKVLYTTQVTQKTKKYHDGFLKISLKGSFGRQALLYDTSRRLLETRFLKTDEVIQSGGSFAFSGHLVDIGEPEENETGEDLKCVVKEFHVQKSRKWHGEADSNIMDDVEVKDEDESQKKASLYKVLNSMFGAKEFHVQKSKKLHGEDDPIIIDDVEVKGEEKYQNKASLKKPLYSNSSISRVQETKPSRDVPTKKLIRDAHQILSFLQKPTSQESVASHQANCTERPVSSTKESQASDALMLDMSEDIRTSKSQSSEPHNMLKYEQRYETNNEQ